MVDTTVVFRDLSLLLTVAVASHFVIRRFKQSTIIGEIGLGILIGPSVLAPVESVHSRSRSSGPLDEAALTVEWPARRGRVRGRRGQERPRRASPSRAA